MNGHRILLIIGGGIAACKCLDLIRMIRKAGGTVTPVLTRAAEEFVTPLSVSALAGERAHTALFDLNDEAAMEHIQLSRKADLVVVAPATANMMARMAGGHADDLAATLLMATDKPVLIAPAMNVRMWEHPATRRNLATLTSDGIHTIGPNEGDMACGEWGQGRMAEPEEILAAIKTMIGPATDAESQSWPEIFNYNGEPPLKGQRVLVTSGPTHEPIDPVRYIANRSSGTQGAELAAALRDLGAEVELISGPGTAALPEGVRLTQIETAAEMLAAVEERLPVAAAVFCAAVADWRAAAVSTSKVKKTEGNKDGKETGKAPALKLTENPDILKTVARLPDTQRPALVIGFAAETDNVVENATAKRLRKGCDWIVANDVRPETGIMGGDRNAVTVITEAGAETWPEASKAEVARKLAGRISAALTGSRQGGCAA